MLPQILLIDDGPGLLNVCRVGLRALSHPGGRRARTRRRRVNDRALRPARAACPGHVALRHQRAEDGEEYPADTDVGTLASRPRAPRGHFDGGPLDLTVRELDSLAFLARDARKVCPGSSFSDPCRPRQP